MSARQGLAGADLADALGVTQQRCHVLVNRMRDRVGRSIGALTVARYGRKDCDELQQLLRDWDGSFDPRIRKRIAGHVDECETCERTSRRLAAIPLLPAAPAFAAP
ncbi:MAG: sigma-70 family RNA polymerase sigma factor, partial [Ilumatobacteraceae bacterium]